MAENNIAVQEANAAPKLLLNGVEATAQQVYDAFMSGIMRVDKGSGVVLAPAQIYWESADGTQTNPAAVTYAEVRTSDDIVIASVGTKYQEV